ncbi:meiotic recombination protein P22 [Drosophila biarmipes]|uniref:meiotic recombination protein P22 n=1 Tax=Drosophila biarmipes TaxID=125945 RepID=UPI0007E8025A|nr:meiotic recombination protein P22 [Drosophila biarmipes]
MERIQATPSPASTYCTSQYSPLRRSQRLIDKENRESQKILPTCRSPQLFGNTEDEYSELLLQQEKPPSKVVHLKPVDKVVHLGSSEKVVPPEPSNKVVHLKPSDKIIHLKRQIEINSQAKNKNEVQNAGPTRTSQRKRSYQATPKKRGPKPKQPGQTKPKKRQSQVQDDNLGISPSPSKLPLQYPAHFVHQLPPAEDTANLRSSSAPATHLLRFSPTPEDTPDAATHCGLLSKSPSDFESDISMNISLSDSIGEIFGTKDLSCILEVQRPRQYILLEDHLPSLATMLNVDLDRLRNVLEITQGLTHEQILHLPVKQEVEETEDQLN